MPTSPKRDKIRQLALDCFHNQDWPDKELIIVDGENTIGSKMNEGCEKAKGDILIKWDDDDWSCPTRITEQVNRLLYSKVQLTGFYQIYFWDIQKRIASQYISGIRDYVLGTSLCFTKKYWESNKFLDISNGEDLEFQKKAKNAKSILSVRADRSMVATIHGDNIGSGRIKYPQVKPNTLPEEFFRRINGNSM